MVTMRQLHDWDSWEEWTPSNNDDDPTSPDPDDYGLWWDTGPEWWFPHPDMEGTVCSAGFHHVPHRRRRRPAAPVGLARIVDLPSSVERQLPALEEGA